MKAGQSFYNRQRELKSRLFFTVSNFIGRVTCHRVNTLDRNELGYFGLPALYTTDVINMSYDESAGMLSVFATYLGPTTDQYCYHLLFNFHYWNFYFYFVSYYAELRCIKIN